MEDDVEFHQHWHELAPQFWEITPKDFDILYLGCQFEHDVPDHVIASPVFCTHAYIITLQGAKKLYDVCVRDPFGTSTIDCMLIEHMRIAVNTDGRIMPFTWYAWNANMFHDPNKNKPGCMWSQRNHGLVFQDSDLGTFVRPW
jgi:hypothetical protein